MSDATQLERRYRRLLAFYPEAFRREHEQEMLSVLIAGAGEGQRRPTMDEAIDLVRNAILMRLWQMFGPLGRETQDAAALDTEHTEHT